MLVETWLGAAVVNLIDMIDMAASTLAAADVGE